MKLLQYRRLCVPMIVALATISAVSEPKWDYGKIELLRDTWGIPHIFSGTDAGAMYGLGYAGRISE